MLAVVGAMVVVVVVAEITRGRQTKKFWHLFDGIWQRRWFVNSWRKIVRNKQYNNDLEKQAKRKKKDAMHRLRIVKRRTRKYAGGGGLD